MAIEFHCNFCNKLLRTADERAGQGAKCPDCGASLLVPGEKAAGGFDSDEGDVRYTSCPMCGERIRDVAVKCRHCGEYIGGSARAAPPHTAAHFAPHRGGIILAFGILSWAVCIIFGVVAWVMGNTDLAEMDAGRMDPEGRSLTQAGRLIGMIHCIVVLAVIAIVMLFMVVGLGAAAF
jgi:DNA-directed RNA polymerase subunit RPC12/RpoP